MNYFADLDIILCIRQFGIIWDTNVITVTAHRRRCEEFIEQLLESFSVRHGIEITRIPRSIRQMKLKEFDAHGGNIQACVQAMAKQRIADNDSENHAKKRYVSITLLHLLFPWES